MNSPFFSLNWRDLGKGILVAFLATALSSLMAILNAGHLPDLSQLQHAAIVGATAAAAYLLKQFITNSQGSIATTEPKKMDQAPNNAQA